MTSELRASASGSIQGKSQIRLAVTTNSIEPPEPSTGSSRGLRDALQQLAAYAIPVGVVLTLAGTPAVPAVFRYRSEWSTSVRVVSALETVADYLTPTRELVDAWELQRLKALWALPYAGDLEFDFREYD